jgi:hypothetical protein
MLLYRILILSASYRLSLIVIIPLRVWVVSWVGCVNMINKPTGSGNQKFSYEIKTLCITYNKFPQYGISLFQWKDKNLHVQHFFVTICYFCLVCCAVQYKNMKQCKNMWTVFFVHSLFTELHNNHTVQPEQIIMQN